MLLECRFGDSINYVINFNFIKSSLIINNISIKAFNGRARRKKKPNWANQGRDIQALTHMNGTIEWTNEQTIDGEYGPRHSRAVHRVFLLCSPKDKGQDPKKMQKKNKTKTQNGSEQFQQYSAMVIPLPIQSSHLRPYTPNGIYLFAECIYFNAACEAIEFQEFDLC